MDQNQIEAKHFFEEVEEEFKYKQVYRLWKQYGKHLLVALGVSLLIAISNLVYKNYSKKKYELLTDQYMEALHSIESGDYEGSLKQLDYLLTQGNKEFNALVQLQRAYAFEMVFDKSKNPTPDLEEKIYNIYQDIQKSSSPKFYKEMAIIIAAHGPFPEKNRSEIMKELEVLSISNAGWHYLALEAMMVQYGVVKNYAKMKEIALKLKDDMQIPKSIQERAEAVLEMIYADGLEQKTVTSQPNNKKPNPTEKKK